MPIRIRPERARLACGALAVPAMTLALLSGLPQTAGADAPRDQAELHAFDEHGAAAAVHIAGADDPWPDPRSQALARTGGYNPSSIRTGERNAYL